MFLRHKKLELPTADEALPGRNTEIPVADRHTVLDTPLKGPWPEGTQVLNDAGYKNAVNIRSGIEGWQNAGHPVKP